MRDGNKVFEGFTNDKVFFSWNDIMSMLEQAADYDSDIDLESVKEACEYVLETWKA